MRAGGLYGQRTLRACHALLAFSSLCLGDRAIVSASIRRSVHPPVVLRFSASASRYRGPHTSAHALHHHTVSALPVAHRRHARGRWSRLVPASSSSLSTLKEGLQGAPPARIFARKMSLLSAAQNFLPLRGADRMAPCGAGNLFDGEARAQKWLEKCAGAESTRLVALVPKIKVRCANTAGNTGAAGCR